MSRTKKIDPKVLAAKLLRIFQEHLEIRVTDDPSAVVKTTGIFKTLHVAQEGVFILHPEEQDRLDTIIHEFGHLVAWLDLGSPQVDDFGCAHVRSDAAKVLEYLACCVEMHLRKTYLGEGSSSIAERMLGGYSYEETLPWKEGKGYVGQKAFMSKALERGALLTAKWAMQIS